MNTLTQAAQTYNMDAAARRLGATCAPTPAFAIGDRVTAIALPNAIPRPREAIAGMVIESRRLIVTKNPRDLSASVPVCERRSGRRRQAGTVTP